MSSDDQLRTEPDQSEQDPSSQSGLSIDTANPTTGNTAHTNDDPDLEDEESYGEDRDPKAEQDAQSPASNNNKTGGSNQVKMRPSADRRSPPSADEVEFLPESSVMHRGDRMEHHQHSQARSANHGALNQQQQYQQQKNFSEHIADLKRSQREIHGSQSMNQLQQTSSMEESAKEALNGHAERKVDMKFPLYHKSPDLTR